MPPDEFKTQVLLLHSEQSTLDNLSAGFGDRYTVHCATSGSEALSTLGDTPINVIVSAQNLPGMSGLEALREAKKRSPDTIGILIDEGTDAGLEAVVGNEEVLQVVRGNVSRKTILELVDDATEKLRLMTLSVSANDNAANVDDPDSEHIVMETTQDGLTIVTDSSGRMPILDPQKVAETADARSQSVDLLVLTRDSDFLETIKGSCRTAHTVHYASTLAQANQTIREFPVGVAVIDAGMIGRKIEQLTEYLRRSEPRLVPIVAGRRDDGEMLMDLINRGKVYRFLLKPVSSGRARLAIESSAKFHVDAPDAAFDRKKGPMPTANPKQQSRSPSRRTTDASKDQEAMNSQTGLTGELAVGDDFDDAFGNNGQTFTDTISGFFNTLGKKSATDASVGDPDANTNEVEPGTTDSQVALGWRSMSVVAALVAITVLAGAYFWLGNRSYDGETVKQAVPEEQPVITAPAEREFVTVDETFEGIADDGFVAEALTAAENALLESRLDDAAAALQRAGIADPDNVRLPFLNAQLSRARLQQYLREARSAILDSRFEDAGSALAAARSMNPASTAEIDLLENELAEARAVQLANDVLVTANDRLESGALLAPPDDNARYFFELALATDPENAAARQGLSVIASKLALQARSEIEESRLDAAEELLATAKTLDPSNTELAAATATLSSRRDAIAAKRAAEAANRRASAASRPAVEPPGQAAADVDVETSSNDDTPAANTGAPAEPAPPAVDSATEQPKDIADAPAATTTVAADVSAAPDSTLAAADTDVTSDEQSAAPVSLAMISSLRRIKYVAPRYPRSAERRKLSGWVDVHFTVATDGTVKDIEIPKAEPGEIFVSSATKAVAKWQFDPVVEDGAAVEKRVGVRLMFALE